MALPDLTGQNIENTYERLVTVEGGVYYDGTGSLLNLGSSDEAESIHIAAKNTSGVTITKGTPVYITGNVGGSEKLTIAAADASDPSKMPAVGLSESDLNNNDEGFIAQGGYLKQITTDVIDGVSANSNDTVYVKVGGGLTLTKPTGSGLIQNIAKVARVHQSNGSLIVSSILRTNDVPNFISCTQITSSIISASGNIEGLTLGGTLSTAVQTGITQVGILTTLTVDNLKLDSNTLSSTSDSDVFISLGTNGIGFNATDDDEFTFNSDQNNVNLHFTGQGDQNLFHIDSSEDKIGIGTNTPGEKLEVIGNISASGDLIGANVSGSGLFISGAGGVTVLGNRETSGSIKFFDNDLQGHIEMSVKDNHKGTELSGIFAGRGYEGNETGYLGWTNVDGGSQNLAMGARNYTYLQSNGNTIATVKDFGFELSNNKRLIVNSHITASGNISSSASSTGSFGYMEATTISASDSSSNFSLYAYSASFHYLSASTGDFDANTIKLGGTPFSKSDIDKLKSGKPISTDLDNLLVSPRDDNTFIRTSAVNRMALYAGGTPSVDIKNTILTLGGLDGDASSVPVQVTSALTASIVSASSLTASIHGGTF